MVIGSPVAPDRPRRAEVIANSYLAGLRAKYYEFVQAASPASQPSVRVDVMLPTSRWKLWRYLRIYYTATLPGGASYTNEERAMPWRKGQGLGGWAWKQGEAGVFDAQRDGFGGAAKSLSAAQKQMVDMASLLAFEPFSHYPQGLKIRVHDESRLDSLGRSVARQGRDGVLVLDLDEVLAKTEEPAAPASGASAPER